MSSGIGFYHYNHDPIFYTGNSEQPDVVSLFVISDKASSSIEFCHEWPVANAAGYFLIASIVSGGLRVANAVQAIFQELSQVAKWEKDDPHLQECWNATKNLCRGLVEICILTGGFLFLYDLFRSKIFIQKEIQKDLEERKALGQEILGKGGIAINGKVLFVIDLTDLIDEKEPEKPLTNNKRLDLLSNQLSEALKLKEEERIKIETEKESEAKSGVAPDPNLPPKKEHPPLKDFLFHELNWIIIPDPQPKPPEVDPAPEADAADRGEDPGGVETKSPEVGPGDPKPAEANPKKPETETKQPAAAGAEMGNGEGDKGKEGSG